MRVELKNWEHFFSPEFRNSARSLSAKDKIRASQLSDTETQLYVGACKVVFKTSSVGSSTLTADCNCSQSKKGRFCKHIWAGLLTLEENKSDLLESKTDLQKKLSTAVESKAKPKLSPAQQEIQAAYKLRQNEYRQQQYQKQKQRLKDQKKAKKNISEHELFAIDVEAALKFFSDNGFELRESMSKESVGAAKKSLARIFHPDVGGSHDEILELNKFSEILMKYFRNWPL